MAKDKWNYSDCRHFKLIKTTEEGELDMYYCGHPDNEDDECEFASCPLNFSFDVFEDLIDIQTEQLPVYSQLNENGQRFLKGLRKVQPYKSKEEE